MYRCAVAACGGAASSAAKAPKALRQVLDRALLKAEDLDALEHHVVSVRPNLGKAHQPLVPVQEALFEPVEPVEAPRERRQGVLVRPRW